MNEHIINTLKATLNKPYREKKKIAVSLQVEVLGIGKILVLHLSNQSKPKSGNSISAREVTEI